MDVWYKILNMVALLLIPIVAVIVGQKLQERRILKKKYIRNKNIGNSRIATGEMN